MSFLANSNPPAVSLEIHERTPQEVEVAMQDTNNKTYFEAVQRVRRAIDNTICPKTFIVLSPRIKRALANAVNMPGETVEDAQKNCRRAVARVRAGFWRLPGAQRALQQATKGA
jgi:hypothetical protein